jgi:4-carboxymuconolactone decarboxylase
MYEYEESARYQNGERVLAETGVAPKALHHWRNIEPTVGPVLDRMLGEFCFGDVWAREELDYRTRRIITITTIATLGRPTLLRTHIKGALDQGIPRSEVLEIFIHMIPYAGFPVVLSCIEVAVEVFAAIDAQAAATDA